MSILNRGKKILSLIVIVSFCFLIFQATPMSANSNSSKKVIKKSDVGVIEQQADWDQPVKKKKKKSILPWILGGLALAGVVVLLIVLLKKGEDPRGTWELTMQYGADWIPSMRAFEFNFLGGTNESGTWTLANPWSDFGTWTMDGKNITIRATSVQGISSDFILTGEVTENSMSGTFDWPHFGMTGKEWSATRLSGPPENAVKKTATTSLEKAVKNK